ncbi:MAG: hypothetical protein IPF59_13610 [Ignavibacteria bacterium]|nr:hypothetical protein [Ignavibacteria bacterium]MBK7412507.1 hypothetical protein [Ignavibacteria bacterium]
MAKVLFRVSYSIADGKRADYLAAIANVRSFYAGTEIQFALFETKGKHNHFQEVYTYPTAEAYDASDDPEATAPISGAIEKIYSLAKDVSYDVSTEVA